MPLLESKIALGPFAVLPVDVPVEGASRELGKPPSQLRVAGTTCAGLLQLLLLSIRERRTDTARTVAGGKLTHKRPQPDKVSESLEREKVGCQGNTLLRL